MPPRVLFGAENPVSGKDFIKAAREDGSEAWYSDRMRKLGLQVTELKKRKESIQEQKKKREEYKYLDRKISRMMSETGRESG